MIQQPQKSFNDYLVKSILATNQFGIKNIDGIQCIVSANYDWDYYKAIEQHLLNKDLESVLLQQKVNTEKTMFLEVVTFFDQHGMKYAAIVYDSLILEQDPHVIEVFPLH